MLKGMDDFVSPPQLAQNGAASAMEGGTAGIGGGAKAPTAVTAGI